MKYILFSLILFLTAFTANSRTLYAIAYFDGGGFPISKKWDQNGTWSLTDGGASCACTPACGDTLYIGADITVKMQNHETYICDTPLDSMKLIIDGTLDFVCGKKLTLPTGSIIDIGITGQLTGCSGGESNYIDIGLLNVWSSSDGDLSGPIILPTPFQLPIELISFSVAKDNNSAIIKWATSSETNNDYFSIQRSHDGFNFETISTIAGAGNSNYTINYTDIDKEPLSGVSYYKLKQTDFDGKYEYSNIVIFRYSADNTTNNNLMAVYPNPVSKEEDLYVSINGFEAEKEVLLVIIDILGQELYSKVLFTDFDGSTVSAIDPHKSLPTGTYIIIGSSDNSVYKKRLVIK